MQVINDFDNDIKFNECVATVGTFDGLHAGHLEIIKKMNNAAAELGLNSVVITFSPHPRSVVSKNYDIKLLTVLDEKKKILEGLGVDSLLILKFSEEFSKKTYKEFFDEILISKVNAKHLIIGYDHKFGKGRDGDINKLVEYSKSKDIGITIVGPEEIDNHVVSSTKIREALLHGNIVLANKMLGRNYTLSGVVVEGTKRGRTLGFPTANLEIQDKNKLIPQNGVYFVKVNVEDLDYYGVTNIGLRPTFNHAKEPITEVHILNFNKDIYGKKLTISFIEHIRDEKKFSSKEELEAQIKIDIKRINKLINEINN